MNPRIMKKVSKRIAKILGDGAEKCVYGGPFAEEVWSGNKNGTSKQKREYWMSLSSIERCCFWSSYCSYIGDGDCGPLGDKYIDHAYYHHGKFIQAHGEHDEFWCDQKFIRPKFRVNAKHAIAFAKSGGGK